MIVLVFRPHPRRAPEDLAESGQYGLQASRQRVSLLHEKRMRRTSPYRWFPSSSVRLFYLTSRFKFNSTQICLLCHILIYLCASRGKSMLLTYLRTQLGMSESEFSIINTGIIKDIKAPLSQSFRTFTSTTPWLSSLSTARWSHSATTHFLVIA